MSEYQYYEFVAIDNPLTPSQIDALRDRSTRATITPTSFVNVYHWGNLKADPYEWMRLYFDAHVYIADWGNCVLALRLPIDALDAATCQAFEIGETFAFDETDTHWIIYWCLNRSDNYNRFAEDDGRGWIGRLVSLRDEIIGGDLRPLYLGWLAAISAGEITEDDDGLEPPRPPGLSRLSAAQKALAEFLEIDPDLIAASADADTEAVESDPRLGSAQIDTWLATLSAEETESTMKMLLNGNGRQAERTIKSRFMAWQRAHRPGCAPELPRRCVAQLRALAETASQERIMREAERRNIAEQERHAQREAHLRTLAKDFERCWQAVEEHATRGIASAYDAAARGIIDLADAYKLCSTAKEFDRALRRFLVRHIKRAALVRRLVEAGLWEKS